MANEVMPETFIHSIYNDCTISLNLFKDVKNAKELRQCVMNGEFQVTLLKTSMIADTFQVLTAATRAVHLYKCNRLITNNVHSEVLFCLSPTKNITESFRKFGMGDHDTSVFVVLINDHNGKLLDQLKAKIQGVQVPLGELSTMTDVNAIKKIYKVSDTELKCSSLIDGLVSRIASKDFLTV